MAGLSRDDWEELNVTKEEVENLTQALKKEEFRKLLVEYAEEITDPKNRKQYQDDIVQLEAERGVDCTFVNPEPGFVIKTSVDGKKKAFVNICKNSAVGRPTSKPELKENRRGLSWSIPLCQAPGREDFDKKNKRCMVYDVIFHPDALHLAEKNEQFKKLIIDTALNAVEDSYGVKVDKKNIKLPKLNFKGLPFATVIRKKSKNQPTLTEEDIEFHNAIKYPLKPPKENNEPIVKNFDYKKKDAGKYTTPKYVIKHCSSIDLQEFTYDKNAKLNAAIPKQLVIEVDLPLLSNTSTVTLDVMEKSLHLLCEKPAKYKLDIQLPYTVNEETGNAKFDVDKRLLIITLPVVKAKMSSRDLMRDDSGVESDSSPVGSISNHEFENADEKNIPSSIEDSCPILKNDSLKKYKTCSDTKENETIHKAENEFSYFLDSDKYYLLPSYSCTLDGNNVCFVLNVKNVDDVSVVTKKLTSSACHIKFLSIGSGFFPVYYAFLVDFKDQCNIENVTCDTWDNNVTVLIELVKNDQAITKYYIGLKEDSLTENSFSHPLELKKVLNELIKDAREEVEEQNKLSIKVESANVNEVVINVIPEEPEISDNEKESGVVKSLNLNDSNSYIKVHEEKLRTLSESSADEIVSSPLARKSILKKRICRSLSESNADDYVFSSSVDKTISEGSDICVNEEHENIPCIKKTVRFSEKIRQQLFRVNSSILGQRKKNKKKSRNKRRAMERRLSEGENSESEDKERDKKPQKSNKCKNNSLIKIMPNNEEKERCVAFETVKNENPSPPNSNNDDDDNNNGNDDVKQKYGLKKDDKIFEFKSDLIFTIDM